MSPYVPEPSVFEDLERRFTYHPPQSSQTERYEQLRVSAKLLSMQMVGLCPKSRELSLALTKLEESVFWANASIARNENLGE